MKSKIKFRSTAILVNNGRLLLHRRIPDSFWALPGGNIAHLEKSGSAIIREIREELGAVVTNLELMIVDEHIYDFENEKIHEIGFYYKCSLNKKGYSLDKSEFNGIEKEKKLVFRWVASSEFEELNYKPSHLKARIREIAFE